MTVLTKDNIDEESKKVLYQLRNITSFIIQLSNTEKGALVGAKSIYKDMVLNIKDSFETTTKYEG